MKTPRQIFLFTILLFTSCNIFFKNSNNPNTAWNDKRGVFMDMNYTTQEADSFILHFDTISKDQFLNFKKKYNDKIDTNNSRISICDTSFFIKTIDSLYPFRSDTNDYSRFAYYQGFLKPLSLFIVTDIDGNNEVGDLILIDKQNNYKYHLSSFFDDPCVPPYISPKNNFFVSFSNDSYEDNGCFITVMKINKCNGNFNYQGLINTEIVEWKIEDLIWINENSFAIKIITLNKNDESTEETKQLDFLKISFEKTTNG